jgi:xanthine dehydrogenase small subunit
VTVEGLKYDGQLNPVQEAMVTCQGSQCGFCTPGFVVSMCSMFEERKRASMEDVKRTCVGNLCRCTGYDSIMRAGAEVDPAKMRPLNELYPTAEIANDLRAHQDESLSTWANDKSFFKATTITDMCRYRGEHPGCMIIAGGTDVGVQMNKCLRDPKEILSIGGVREMNSVSVANGSIVAGALASIADLEQVCRDSLPEYSRVLYWFGSPPIKNAGTIGGNIGNGSPIADSMPAMYVLNAEIELSGVGGSRRVNINDFYTGYKKTVAKPDELITAVHIPLPDVGDIFRLYKVSKRKDLDISAFTAAIWMRMSGGKIGEARIAYGGVGQNIIRLRATEEFFAGKSLDEEAIAAAGEIARGEIAPISDVRGSAEFRNLLGRNILRKFLSEVVPGGSGNGKHEMQPRRHEEREGRREG